MSSIVDVWNLALALLAQDEEILDPQDKSTKAGRLCNRFWPQVRDEILQAAPWSSATVRVSLSASGNPIAYEAQGQHRYSLPADCVRPLALTHDGEADSIPIPFEREGRSLISEAPAPLALRYISRDVPVGDWDPRMIQAAASLLAKYLAVPLTGKNSERERMEAEAQKSLVLAETANGKTATPPESGDGGWLLARN